MMAEMGGEMPSMPSAEICVPLSALAISGDGEEAVAPEPGDQVAVQIEGKVSRVEGNCVFIKAETANGEPMAQMAEGDGMGEEDQLRRDMSNEISIM